MLVPVEGDVLARVTVITIVVRPRIQHRSKVLANFRLCQYQVIGIADHQGTSAEFHKLRIYHEKQLIKSLYILYYIILYYIILYYIFNYISLIIYL